MILYHITDQSQWENYSSETYYLPSAYFSDGFIHCSTAEQVLVVAAKYYADTPQLLLLKIDGECLTSEIKFENLEGNEECFPHIYGPLEKKAILGITTFGKDAGGNFYFPEF